MLVYYNYKVKFQCILCSYGSRVSLDEITLFVFRPDLFHQNIKEFWLSPLIEIKDCVVCMCCSRGSVTVFGAPSQNVAADTASLLILPVGSHHVQYGGRTINIACTFFRLYLS